MSKTIKSCGDIREFLANMMLGVKDGNTKVDEARTIIKAAEKINENYYAEIKVAQMQLQLGRAVAELGTLPVNKE
jgi:hypothetical protein